MIYVGTWIVKKNVKLMSNYVLRHIKKLITSYREAIKNKMFSFAHAVYCLYNLISPFIGASKFV